MGIENGPASRARPVLATALALATLLAAALLAWGASPASSAPSCPSFRVLHNDRIGAASFPAGNYGMNVSPAAGISCAAASKLFARFLEDYDGVLPTPWKVVSEGTGKATFTQRGATAFTVFRTSSGGGEEGASPLGSLCKSPYTVNAGQAVGPLYFRKGQYLLYLPPRSGISCNRASVLFTRFLGSPGGQLPFPWRLKNQTATFFKPEHPTRSAFRVEPAAGAGPS